MRRWDRLLDVYMEQYCARGTCAERVKSTRATLERWGGWMKQRRPRVMLERVEADLLVRYIESRTSFRAKSTVYGTLSTMRGMGDFLVREGIWQVNPLRWMKGPKVTPYHRLPRRIDREHMQALWQEAAGKRSEFQRRQWITVLAMLYGTGLRRGEIERLNIDSFDRTEGTLRIDGRKTGRERCVPVPEILWRCLESYLPQRHNVLERAGALGQQALLVNRRGNRLSGQMISNVIHAMAQQAQVGLVSLHQFRHSCASDLLEAGVHLPEVQRILGHQVIATTVRYTHIADPQRREAMACHPLNDWLAAEAA
jgi:site-specific recombinase XerD